LKAELLLQAHVLLTFLGFDFASASPATDEKRHAAVPAAACAGTADTINPDLITHSSTRGQTGHGNIEETKTSGFPLRFDNKRYSFLLSKD
jgi:hypothetical protein